MEEYVELGHLRNYLSGQYAGMGGKAIAEHRKFCDHVPGRTVAAWQNQKPNGSAKGAGTRSSYVLVPVEEIAPYLEDQYSRRMNGSAIANHRFFLRNVPKFTLTEADFE